MNKTNNIHNTQHSVIPQNKKKLNKKISQSGRHFDDRNPTKFYFHDTD